MVNCFFFANPLFFYYSCFFLFLLRKKHIFVGQNRAMSDTPKSTVKLDLKRTEFGYYTFETTDTVADGDHLWWREANVVFQIIAVSSYDVLLRFGDYRYLPNENVLIAIADPDPLTTTDLSLELEIL